MAGGDEGRARRGETAPQPLIPAQLAARRATRGAPPGATRLDAADALAALAAPEEPAAPVVGDKRRANGRSKGATDKPKPPVATLRKALLAYAPPRVAGDAKPPAFTTVAGKFPGLDNQVLQRVHKKLDLDYATLTESDARAIISSTDYSPRGSADLRARRCFSDGDELYMAAVLKRLFEMGWGLDENQFLAFAADVLARQGRTVDPFTGRKYAVGKGFAEGFYERQPDIRKYRTSSLDPKRARAASYDATARVI